MGFVGREVDKPFGLSIFVGTTPVIWVVWVVWAALEIVRVLPLPVSEWELVFDGESFCCFLLCEDFVVCSMSWGTNRRFGFVIADPSPAPDPDPDAEPNLGACGPDPSTLFAAILATQCVDSLPESSVWVYRVASSATDYSRSRHYSEPGAIALSRIL